MTTDYSSLYWEAKETEEIAIALKETEVILCYFTCFLK